ncbi:MAG: TRL-like family protein [Bryobacterales bacterium]
MHKLVAVPLLLLGLTGCAGVAFIGQGNAVGVLYADTTTPVHATENNLGKKVGEACATSILGIVTTGDASIRAAADAGGIKEIAAVDSSLKNILGIVATHCMIVSGTG